MDDNLMKYIERQSRNLDSREETIVKMAAACQYVSCIRFNGIPILPPVLTGKKKDEMMSYKHQAVLVENKLKAKQRERLMARAERVVKNTQASESVRVKDGNTEVSKTTPKVEDKPPSDPTQGISENTQFKETLDSLSSGLMSLEDGSLPTDFYGLPCTSVHEKQISRVLQKLSKQLNLKDTLGSTGGSEANENPSDSTLTAGRVPDAGSEDSSSGFRDSQDTVVEVLRDTRKNKPSAINIECSDESALNKDSPSRGYISGESSAVSSANTSASERARGSPKSLKNTVHFSEFVKVLNTNRSVEDNITVKRLEETKPENSPIKPKLKPKEKKESPESDSKSHSLLSQVILSPEEDVPTPSPDAVIDIPFQSYRESPSKAEVTEDEKVKPTNKPKSCASPKLKSRKDSETDSDVSEKKFSQSNIRRSSSLRSNRSRNSNQSMYQSQSTSTSAQSGSELGRTSQLNSSQTTELMNTDDSNMLSVQSSGPLSQTATTVSSDTYSQNNSTLNTNDTIGISSSSASQRQFTNTTDSQISAKSDFSLRTSDSGSTLKAEQESKIVGSSTGSSNLYKYMRHLEGTLESSPDNDCRKSESVSVLESSESNLVNGGISHVGRKGHVRRGSYTLETPSPVLIQAQSRIEQNGGTVVGVESVVNPVATIADTSINKPIQRKLDYEDDLEDTRPISLPIPPGPESVGKVEHINKYLNQVQKHNQNESSHPKTTVSITKEQYPSLTGTEAELFLKKIQETSNLSEEEAFSLHKEYFETLKNGLLEQQRSELEELFVHQRREQINLQSEISNHQQQQKIIDEQVLVKKPKSRHQPSNISDYEQEIKDSSFLSSSSLYLNGRQNRSTGTNKNTPKQNLIYPQTSTPSPKVFRPVVRSPVKSQSINIPKYPIRLPPDLNDVETQLKFYKVTALAKGFLTRRLFHSEKVQELIKTIRDTREFAFSFQSETPIKTGTFSNQDRNLLERIIAQLEAALLDIHEIFFIIPIPEKMELIHQTRIKEQQKRYNGASSTMRDSGRKVSSATLKAMERKKKAQEEEEAGFNNRPKTAPATSSPRTHAVDLRALKPLQGMISPIRSDESSSNTKRNRHGSKERPKTAPEKTNNTKEQLAYKNRKISTAVPSIVKTNKTPISNTKSATKIIRKVSSKSSDKAWR
ncbi:centriolar coiled-coil protein of 110 kDa [Patella vulgata]|uniref:centriolar coiled-coil protein of 110 kDa n=1 Tax=Patella vulgata TaxID=6465 RepID=UPI00217F55EC|nr:centriolar coiled-coil protein of 110 kDa [Patella vulgata]XP_050391833.1 centriolar coiled-coil protein of 110 kDa [Patella vulgata]